MYLTTYAFLARNRSTGKIKVSRTLFQNKNCYFSLTSTYSEIPWVLKIHINKYTATGETYNTFYFSAFSKTTWKIPLADCFVHLIYIGYKMFLYIISYLQKKRYIFYNIINNRDIFKNKAEKCTSWQPNELSWGWLKLVNTKTTKINRK